MTNRELIKCLLDSRLDKEVLLCYPKGIKTKIDICGDCVSVIRTTVRNNPTSVVSVKGEKR